MKILHLDFETYSDVDLSLGAFKYSQDESTEVLLCGYSFDDGPVKMWWTALGEEMPEDLRDALNPAEGPTIAAHNASFERCMLTYTLGVELPPERFMCTAALAASMALPRGLDGVAKFLGLEGKKESGKGLIKLFCSPHKPTKKSPITRVYWDTVLEPAKLKAGFRPVAERTGKPNALFLEFADYCVQDVVVERAVHKKLGKDLSETEQAIWVLTEKMNARGIPMAADEIAAATAVGEITAREPFDKFVSITGIDKPTKVQKLKAWVNERIPADRAVTSLAKDIVADMLAAGTLPDVVHEALELRLQLSKAAVAKLKPMKNCAGKDDRVRGCFRYHEATTGRWSGKLIQPQNFARPELTSREYDILSHAWKTTGADMGIAADFLRLPQADIPDAIEMAYGLSFEDFMPSAMRGLIKAPSGRRFIAADYSSIEARVNCWLNNEEHALELYRQDADLYMDMARFIDPENPIRQNGKMSILGCGFQMGAKTFSERNGLPFDVAKKAVEGYRERYPRIKQFWRLIQDACVKAIRTKETQRVRGKLFAGMRRGCLLIKLPSGRCLSYPRAKIRKGPAPWDKTQKIDKIIFKNGHGVYEDTYGGKLTENIVQAIARDLMANGMLKADAAGYTLIMTVHDEAISEVPEDFGTLEEFCTLLCDLPEWAEGLPLVAEGYIGPRFRK